MALPLIAATAAVATGAGLAIRSKKKKKHKEKYNKILNSYRDHSTKWDSWLEKNPEHEDAELVRKARKQVRTEGKVEEKSASYLKPEEEESAAYGKKLKYRGGGYANWKRLMGMD